MTGRRSLRAALLAGSALALGVWSAGGGARAADARAFRAVNRNHSRAADRVLAGLTELGSIYASVGASLALAAAGRRRAAGTALTAAGVTWAIGQGLKRAFARPRPYEDDRDGVRLMIGRPRAASWPSSHPAVLLAFATVAGRELDLSRAGRVALLGLGAAVGVSRTYLGVHYPSDVIGGILLGRAIGLAWPGRV